MRRHEKGVQIAYAHRDGGGVSDRQWGDVLGVTKTQGNRFDLAYLHQWAGRKGIAERLERALGET